MTLSLTQSTGRPRRWREHYRTAAWVLMMLLFRTSYADWMRVPTGSMNPTILEGDYIVVDKHAYGWRLPWTLHRLTAGADPQRGEIAVFYSPTDGTRLVKRVIGLPGDTVALRDNQLIINGQPVRYTPDPTRYALPTHTQALAPVFAREQLGSTAHPITLLPRLAARRDFAAVTLPADRYLVLGDNRDNSADSRYFGLVPRQQFVGRAHHVLLSFDPDHHYLPRWLRSGQPLR